MERSSLTPARLEEFINNYLKEDLKELEYHLNLRNNEIMEFLQLKNTIETIKEHLRYGFKTQMDIGGNIFMEAKIDDPQRILVNIGKDIFMDFSLDEAIKYVEFRIRILNKEVDVIREESIKKRADIKLAVICLGEKQNLIK
ncbi:protein UXT homolog [Condylostylus longicornis]|uniref:protein UXT homolog n=1 Tax=Condylostylus longicornis TaxID=2530218 RepID=UPI00244E59DF|nr:protein UXT homolog [Condylostylus longicornis]